MDSGALSLRDAAPVSPRNNHAATVPNAFFAGADGADAGSPEDFGRSSNERSGKRRGGFFSCSAIVLLALVVGLAVAIARAAPGSAAPAAVPLAAPPNATTTGVALSVGGLVGVSGASVAANAAGLAVALRSAVAKAAGATVIATSSSQAKLDRLADDIRRSLDRKSEIGRMRLLRAKGERTAEGQSPQKSRQIRHYRNPSPSASHDALS
jgi:hypothetical protein